MAAVTYSTECEAILSIVPYATTHHVGSVHSMLAWLRSNQFASQNLPLPLLPPFLLLKFALTYDKNNN